MTLRRIPFALALLVASANAQEATRIPLPADHPLVGSWRAEMPALKCFEEHEIRADGTRTSVSADERAEAEYSISAFPSAKGFYRWTDRVVRTNGKPDCTGHLTPVGQVSVNYAIVLPDGQRFLACTAEDLKTCFAEFRRKR